MGSLKHSTHSIVLLFSSWGQALHEVQFIIKQRSLQSSPKKPVMKAVVTSCESVSHSVVSHSLQTYGLWLTRLLCPWNSPGKNTGVDSHSLLHRIFQTQRENSCFLHCRQTFYCLSHQRSHFQPLCVLKSEENLA